MQEPGGGMIFAAEERTHPDAGLAAGVPNFLREARHVGEAGVGNIPGCAEAIAIFLPAAIDDGPGAIVCVGSEGRDGGGIAQDGFGGADAVGVIPVVGAVDGLRGEARLRAHLGAEGAGGLVRGFGGLERDDLGGAEGAVTELDVFGAVAEVEPEGDAVGVGGPETEGAGIGADAEAAGDALGVDEEVPGHDALGDEAAPGEIAVTAFPMVAEVEGVF